MANADPEGVPTRWVDGEQHLQMEWTRVCGRKPDDLAFDVREPLYCATGIDLTAIEWMDEVHALTLVSERVGERGVEGPPLHRPCSAGGATYGVVEF